MSEEMVDNLILGLSVPKIHPFFTPLDLFLGGVWALLALLRMVSRKLSGASGHKVPEEEVTVLGPPPGPGLAAL